MQYGDTVGIYHQEVFVISDYCGLIVRIGNAVLINHTFGNNGDWIRVPDGETDKIGEGYVYNDEEYFIIIDVRYKWLYVETNTFKLQAYYEIPSNFTIILPK